MGAGIFEVRGRWLEKVGKTTWRGYRRFVTWNDNVPYYCETMRGQTFIGMSGDFAPVITRIRGTDSERQDVSYLHAYYETKRTVGRARIRILTDSSTKTAWMQNGEDGLFLEGNTHADGANEDVIVSGEDYIIDYMPLVIVQMAMPTEGYNPLEICALVGKVNKKPIALLGADSGTMRCVKINQSQTYFDDLIYLDVYLSWKNDGWLSKTEINSVAWVVKRKPVFEGDTDTVIAHRDILVPQPNKKWNGDTLSDDYVTSRREKYKTADFSILSGLMYWEIDS